MDPLSVVEDEVALEGLDGITIPSLWIRLESRRPKFPLKLDDCTKEFVWRSLTSNTELKFYQLPKERDDVDLTDRFKDIDPETGIETTQKSLEQRKDVYPVHIIQDNKDGIQGSCAVFKERTDVTKHVRSKSLSPLITLQEAAERYGRRLVIVASQKLRFRTLIGSESDPDLTLTNESYCVLERVGRARWQGELQKEMHKLSFKIDARKLHYMRKSLVRHGLVSMQSYVTRTKTGQQQHSILLHLKRFYINRRSKYDILMEQMSDYFESMPGQISTIFAVKKHFNLNGRSYRRIFQYMKAAKLVEFRMCPLEELDPSVGPCFNKQGVKVQARCLKLLKPYSQKDVHDDVDDEDEEDDNDSGARKRGLPAEGRIMETDILTQAYQMVLSSGTTGIARSTISRRMNVGPLEARMICRTLERAGSIKGFMVDEGRQRTTKYISHKCVGVSDQLQLFAKEQERCKMLSSSGPQTSNGALATPETPSASVSKEKEKRKTPAKKKAQKTVNSREKEGEEAEQMFGSEDMNAADEGLNGKKEKAGGAGKTKGRKSGVKSNQAQPEVPIMQPTKAEGETTNSTEPTTADSVSSSKAGPDQAEEEERESSSAPAGPLPQNEESNSTENKIEVIDDAFQLQAPSSFTWSKRPLDRVHETYRKLRRKNLVVEAIRNFKVIEGTFPLQKIISDTEKEDGCVTKCCKKTILRLIHSLSREGLVKIYKTTIIQDGITKNIQMYVHPSIQPNDDIVSRTIETVRFKISSSYTATRLQEAEERAKQLEKDKKKEMESFKPTTVRGLGRSLGFQTKMHRLRIVHNFLWYLIYGHPLKYDFSDHANETPEVTEAQIPEKAASGSADPQTAESSSANLDALLGDDGEEQSASASGSSQPEMKVFSDEDSWKRYMPPVRVRKGYGAGWAMMGDLFLCLPLSIFIQVIQINYKVDGLEEYLNDPKKQHYLVRSLPSAMRRQLLYKRKFIFSFYESLQRLVYMGLLQFGPVEKFKDKDQVFVFLRRNATIVDTTSAEPHYWLVTEPPDKPFDRRRYTFKTIEDVENYWFDLMCVCLNTPLGVIRKRDGNEDESAPSFVGDRYVFVGLSYLLRGSREVCDDGSIPGDAKGAGGLHSEFFSHLKRNWMWTNHLLAVKKTPASSEVKEATTRLNSLLSKHALRIALKAAGGLATPQYVTNKKSKMPENIEVGIEPASRNKQVVGGKNQKRKRSKKEVVKPPRKRKRGPRKRGPAHDEVDHKALKMMTRQRVLWTVQEDSLLMLCSVAAHLFNSKSKRPFVPYCVVRDLLHAEYEKSADKTSSAVGRRARYILKNPQTLLNYRISLAEVYEDKPLMKTLEKSRPTDPDSPEECATAFSEYVRLLRERFSSYLIDREVVIPDTKHELFSQFRVSAIESRKKVPSKDTLSCTDDIHACVLHNLIQSSLAMTNNQMKSSRSFLTFHMYSNYNQELLCQVLIECRKRGLANRRRVNRPFGPKKNRGLPILPMSYQLSQSFYRCFAWRFPHLLFTDSFRLVRSLMANKVEEDKPLTTFYLETENRSVQGEVMEKSTKKNKKTSEGGAAHRLQSEPENANSDSVKEDEDNQRKAEEEDTPMDVSEERLEAPGKPTEQKNQEDSSTAGSPDDPSAEEQAQDHPAEAAPMDSSAEAAEKLVDESDMLQFSLDAPGGACVASLSLLSLGLLSVHLSIPKQMVVVDSTMVDNDAVKSMAALEDEDEDDNDCEGSVEKKTLQVKAHQASHTNYLMMRGYCSPGIVKLRNLNTNDNIVLESCNVRLQLRNKPAHTLFIDDMSGPPELNLIKYGPSLVPPNLTYTIHSSLTSSPSNVKECEERLMEQRGYMPQDIEAFAQIRQSLDGAGEYGVDDQDFRQTHLHLQEPQCGRTRSLQQYLKELQEEGQVLKVGSLGPRWVLIHHAKPWLLTLNPKQWSQSGAEADQLSSLQRQRTLPFLQKKCRRATRRAKDEPPAKKSKVDEEDIAEKEDKEVKEDAGVSSSDVAKEKVNEEQPDEKEENPDEEGAGKGLTVLEEGGEKKQSEEKREEEVGNEKVEAEGKQERRRGRRSRRGSINDEKDEDGGKRAEAADVNNDENTSFISRPWRMVDGNLNRQVLKGMLEGVLYHVMYRPGLTHRSLVEHYRDSLQPVAVMELLEALINMGCVKKRTLVKAPKPSLFSRSETPKMVDDLDCVFYEPTISCCLRLAQVLPNERHWNCVAPPQSQ